MAPMKLYLAGPMTGMPNFNDPAFQAAEDLLVGLGHRVESPHHRESPPTNDPNEWGRFMAAGIAKMINCGGIVLLKGWSRSKGAKRELSLALEMDMEVFYLRGKQLVPIS